MIENIKNIYFRGYLSSCNYSCTYCRFAKGRVSETELSKDEESLNRFCNFIETVGFRNNVSIFLTPYGEGLIHEYYIKGLARLALNPKCSYISCQTNLSFDENRFIKILESLNVDLSKVKLWASCHPEMTPIGEYVKKVNNLKASIDLSVGIVAIPKDLDNVFRLRKELPKDIYMWINAKDGEKTRYSKEQIQDLIELDPLFYNEIDKNRVDSNCCTAGTDSVFIEANGDVYPCHINKHLLFNIYRNLDEVKTFKCGRRFCDCYLVYSHRKDSDLNKYFECYTPTRIPYKKDIQAIFLDIDGTITNENGTIRKEAAESIEALKDKARIYLATSLPLHIAMRKCNAIKSYISGGVFANGGQIVDRGLDYFEVVALEKESLDMLQYIPNIRIYSHDGLVYKALALRRNIRSLFELSSVARLTCEKDLISINSEKASKLNGILKLCKLNKFREDKVFVMGNSVNDLEMLEYFENSVASINSDKAVRKRARYIFNIEHLAMFVR